MLTSVTGSTVGIENKTSSNAIHNTATGVTGHPTVGPMVHLAAFTSLRRCHMEMAQGTAYEIASDMTPTETKARNAEEEPRLIRPRSICTTVVRARAKMGVSCLD